MSDLESGVASDDWGSDSDSSDAESDDPGASVVETVSSSNILCLFSASCRVTSSVVVLEYSTRTHSKQHG